MRMSERCEAHKIYMPCHWCEFEQLQAQNTALESENAALREAQRWVPVGERLPNDGVRVLVCHDGDNAGDRINIEVRYGSEHWSSSVTHWQHLPTPPETPE